jgi:hypothetical protein
MTIPELRLRRQASRFGHRYLLAINGDKRVTVEFSGGGDMKQTCVWLVSSVATGSASPSLGVLW